MRIALGATSIQLAGNVGALKGRAAQQCSLTSRPTEAARAAPGSKPPDSPTLPCSASCPPLLYQAFKQRNRSLEIERASPPREGPETRHDSLVFRCVSLLRGQIGRASCRERAERW